MFKVVVGQRVVPEQREFVGRQIEERRALSFGENMSPWHAATVPIEYSLFWTTISPYKSRPSGTKIHEGSIGTARRNLLPCFDC